MDDHPVRTNNRDLLGFGLGKSIDLCFVIHYSYVFFVETVAFLQVPGHTYLIDLLPWLANLHQVRQ